MNVAAAASHRILGGIAWGAFGVLALATLTVLMGGSAAHADEEPETPLGTLTSLVGATVEETASLATPLATDVLDPAVQTVVETVVAPVVAPVVQQTVPQVVESAAETVQSAPIIGDAAQPVLDSVTPVVTETVAAVSSPVTDVLQSDPVATITEPVLQTVSAVAGGEVGELLTDLGVTATVRDVAGAVDATAGVIGGTVEATVPPVLGSLNPPAAPETPDAPDLPDASEGPDAPDAAHVPGVLASADGADVPADAANTSSTPVETSVSFGSPISSRLFEQLGAAASDPGFTQQPAGATPQPNDGPQPPPASMPSPASPTSTAGSGSGFHSDAARLDDSAPGPLRGWTHTNGAHDDALPSSPVADADVSPD